MCGQFSANNGSIKCGMNLCCAWSGWCGYDEIHCGDPDPSSGEICQRDYGSCEPKPQPSCGESGSSNGRTIAYYQASNVRDRLCNRIDPAHINTTGLTHLYFAFASIDPQTFAVVPTDPEDEPIYSQFTSLKTSSLETWIGIGGFDFSDPGTATHTTWSDMCSNEANREKFISSLISFMEQYGFQGADLDWEYPANADRGGKPEDTGNYVSLVKEMRAAFGTKYGISYTIAPDITYVTGFDAIGMQPYVNWVGFMAYDLHGFWDGANPTLGAFVRGQTNIQEISNDTYPLWMDGLDPGMINFGIAYYGRGYTLSSSTCNTLGCPFVGGNEPGKCTNFAGVMSLTEIEELISEKGLVPELLSDIAMKQITWDNQWMGYDDSETIALKKQFADRTCFGGTMIWSIDYYSGIGDLLTRISGDTPTNPNAVNTTDGTCGTINGTQTVCGDWPQGSCCSSAGFCGNTPAHCGSGCQSGPCTIGGVTTDGTCGSANHFTTCGDWPQGSCCSSAGFCGNDTAHCGSGCQSGPCTGNTIVRRVLLSTP
ncbi:bacteriodes thetaiotaomicron symbiotic chitinase [Xylogone sp. PMI_703]|nr:bacteriodes thetaiotaomicron symbiotic chitinase [Xylogone sp. PMI_703]